MQMRMIMISMAVAAAVALFGAKPENVVPSACNWPSFRGLNASGIAEGYATPVRWNVATKQNLKWKTPIPGLSHASPIVWGDGILVTTAISGKEKAELKVGLYGNVTPVDDDTVHQWKVYCLGKKTGKILWEQLAHSGVPKIKRHPKAQNSLGEICMATPAISEGALFFRTQGHVVAVAKGDK